MKRKTAITALVGLTLMALGLLTATRANGQAIAHLPESKQARLTKQVRTASISARWAPIVALYTDNNYGLALINQLAPHAPHGSRRGTILNACVKYHVPLRLLLGIWGAESTWGRGGTNHFGLIGPAIGNLKHDANYAARLLSRLYRNRYHRNAL